MTDFENLMRFVVLVAVVAIVLGAFFGTPAVSDGGSVESLQQTFGFTSGTADLEGSNHTVTSVEQSLGQAAQLDGSASSYVSSDTEPTTSDNWTLSTWVRVRDTTSDQLIYADTERTLIYNGSANEFVAVWYNDSTQETYVAREVANSPESWTHVSVEGNIQTAADVTLYENNSDSATASTPTTANVSASNLNGSVEETRVHDRALSSSERQQLVDTPTAPLTGARAYRVMYDSFDSPPSTYPAAFVSGGVTASNVVVVDGFDGQAADRGTDWELSGGLVQALSGGSLENAPLVYISYEAATGGVIAVLDTLAAVTNSGLQLLAVGVIIGAAALLLNFYREF